MRPYPYCAFAFLVVLFACGCVREQDDVPQPEISSVASAMAPSESVSAQKPWRLIHVQGALNFVYMDAAHKKNQDQYQFAIAEVCGTRPICQVLFWSEKDLVPTMLPMSDEQLASKVAHWEYNVNTDHRRLLWSCELVDDSAECF